MRPVPPMRRATQSGLTMIEMMISVALGLLLFLVLIGIYLSSRQTFNAQNNLARMQEGARNALGVLSREIQMAGFMGCANAGLNGDKGIAAPIKGYASLASYQVDTGNPSLDNGPFSGIEGPIVVVRHGSATTIPLASAMAGVGADTPISITGAPGKWQQRPPTQLISDCVSGERFVPTSISATAIQHSGLGRTYGSDARVMALESSVFFLAQPTGRPFLSLFQRFTDGATTQDVRLADHVEQWLLSYGYGDSDATLSAYTDEAGIDGQTGKWNSVKAVRIHLLVTSAVPVLDQPTPYSFNLTHVSAPQDRLLRKEVATTIGLRNRVTSIPSSGT